MLFQININLLNYNYLNKRCFFKEVNYNSINRKKTH